MLSHTACCTLVSVCRYLLVCVASAEPNLEAASDHFSEILLLFMPSPSRLAPRHREDEGVCPWTHTDSSSLLPRASRTPRCPPAMSTLAPARSPQAPSPWALVSPKSPPSSCWSSSSPRRRRCSQVWLFASHLLVLH